MEERVRRLNLPTISADEARVVAAIGPQPKPERFGRYLLLDRIGSGGMAEVYRAVMPGAQGFRQTFVVKRILAERSRATDFVDMFVQEARIGSMLSHPNIVQVFDFGNVGGDYFLAMEYLRGRDVQALMRKLREQNLPCPVPVAAFIAHEVAVCLGYAHDLLGADGKRLNIVHRDVSPSNIMCLRTGGVKLLDFGIAKAAGENTENTEQGLFKGKLAYVAPERIKNEPLDGRVDLFGLGVVLWEMLCGRRLFRGKSELETLNNVLEMKVRVPSTLRPEVPPALDAIVMRALARNRDERYPTGYAMADDLETVLHETSYQSKMLADLLREAFGTDISRSQEAMSTVTPEMLASLSSDQDSMTAELPTDESVKSQPRRWKKVAAVVTLMGAAAALGVLMMGRGGGGSSQAHEEVVTPPALVIPPAIDPIPTEAPGEPAAPAKNAPAEAAREDAEHAGKGDRRHHHRSSSSSSKRGQADRVVRGLSIDPFEEAKK
jgi:serine/threonine protein kinase